MHTRPSAVLELSCDLGADVGLETAGGDTLARSVGALAEFGRMVTTVGDATGDFGAAYRTNAAIYPRMMERDGGRLDRTAALVEAGDIEPLVADVLPLSDAHRRIEAGGVHGKLALTP